MHPESKVSLAWLERQRAEAELASSHHRAVLPPSRPVPELAGSHQAAALVPS